MVDIHGTPNYPKRRLPSKKDQRMLTMDFKVKTGVPIPELAETMGRKKGRGKWQVLVNSMAVGDCVDIPETSYNPIYVSARRMGIDLTRRDIGAGLIRVWRNN